MPRAKSQPSLLFSLLALLGELFQSKMKQVFSEADAGGDGRVDKAELYTMVLRMYLFVAQYTIVAAQVRTLM